jgi:hypothetical protein
VVLLAALGVAGHASADAPRTAPATTGSSETERAPTLHAPSETQFTLRLAGPEHGFSFRVYAPDPPLERHPIERARCGDDCRLVLRPGFYTVEALAPADSGYRRSWQPVWLAEDTQVTFLPGDRATHRWGVGLTVGGAISLGVGLLLTSATFMVAGGPRELTPAKVVSLGLLGVGAASTVAGIDLLAISRNRVAVSLARARAE